MLTCSLVCTCSFVRVCVYMCLYMKLSFHEVSFKISWDMKPEHKLLNHSQHNPFSVGIFFAWLFTFVAHIYMCTKVTVHYTLKTYSICLLILNENGVCLSKQSKGNHTWWKGGGNYLVLNCIAQSFCIYSVVQCTWIIISVKARDVWKHKFEHVVLASWRYTEKSYIILILK